MDLTSGLLLFAIGIPVSIAVFYAIMYVFFKEYKNNQDKKKKTGWKGDDCQ